MGSGLTRPLAVVTDDRHHLHDPPFELNGGSRVSPPPERPSRLAALREGLADIDHVLVDVEAHGDGPLLAVHDAGLVDFLDHGYERWREAGGPDPLIPDTFVSSRWASMDPRPPTSPLAVPGWWCFDTASPLTRGSGTAARAAADVALTAAGLLREDTSVAYALTRPPGHHTGVRTYGGFCLLNPAAVAARALSTAGRVAIVDIDVHHGNGTQEIFWTDPEVLYASLHGDPSSLFPFATGHAREIGGGAGLGATINVPLPPGTGDGSYLAELDEILAVVDRYAPTAVVVSLGFDAAAGDPLGPLALTPAGFAEVGRRIGALQRPTLLVQEGGYAEADLGPLLAATLGGLLT
ncbi:MAG: histone deacetylase family protein [Nitriliruptor sp.]